MLIYDKFTELKLKSFDTNGLGYLKDFKTNPQITRELNGTYKLEFEYALDGLNSEYLEKLNIIKCKYNGKYQLFRIFQITKNKTIKIYALHIFFDLYNNFLLDVRPTNQSGTNALRYILSHTSYENSFEVTGNVISENTAYYVRKNPIEAILTADNSLINVWGGEIDLDNFTIDYKNQIGNDNGVFVEFGKNLKSIEMLTDITETATRIMPIGNNELMLPEKFIDSPLINNYPFPLIKTVEVDVSIDEETPEEQAYEIMRNYVNDLYKNGADLPSVNIKIDYQDLSKTIEYQNFQHLESINLGDTITTKVWGMEIKTRVIKIIYDVLKEKIVNFELGSEKASLVNEQNNMIQKQMENLDINPESILIEAQNNASRLLTSALGGYVIKTREELFIVDNEDPQQAKNVWRWNIAGLGFSKNGINGPYETAITSDGKIVANFITTGTMSVERIQGLLDELSGINNSIEINQQNINLITSQITDDFYGKEQINELIENAKSGLTNIYSTTGGLNIFRNTSLAFAEGDGFEFWQGTLDRGTEENSATRTCILLKNGSCMQNQEVLNGNYYISFKYKRLISLAIATVTINNKVYDLEQTADETLFELPITVTAKNIEVKFSCDTNSGYAVYELMVNAGETKAVYSQNQNETTTSTVNISKGIEVINSNINAKTRIDADGQRTINLTTDEVVNRNTDQGTDTKTLTVHEEANIVGMFVKEIKKDHIWITFGGKE